MPDSSRLSLTDEKLVEIRRRMREAAGPDVFVEVVGTGDGGEGIRLRGFLTAEFMPEPDFGDSIEPVEWTPPRVVEREVTVADLVAEDNLGDAIAAAAAEIRAELEEGADGKS